MRNAMWVGGGITGMGEIPMLGVREKGLAKVIRDIFRNGEQGFFYDPSDMAAMYQDVAGTIPVTVAGQPVGLMLDKSKGLTYGEELVTDGNFENNLVGSLSNDGGSVSTWELNTNAPISGSRDAKLNVTTPAANRPFLAFPSGLKESGAVYEFSFDYKILTGSPRIRLVGMGAVIGTDVPLTGSGKFVAQCVCTGTSNNANAYFGSSSAYSLQIDNVSVRRVLGNHAYQTTSASRPILRQNAVTGANYLEFDGSDDFLQTSNIDFTSTDELGIFACIRNPSQARSGSFQVVVELGADTASNNGAFMLSAPHGTFGNIQYSSRGTTRSNNVFRDITAEHRVITAKSDISSNLNSIRVNGGAYNDAGGTQGTGNYGNYPLYIGRREGTSLPFNGHIYGLIGIGKLTTDTVTAAIEKELAKRTGVDLNV